MMNWSLFNADGVYIGAYSAPDATAIDAHLAAMPAGTQAVADAVPATPAWPVTATADVEVSVAGYPAGTVAEVLWGGAIVATVAETDGVIAITFGDPGEWRVRIAPPFPWLPATAAVTVLP